MVFSLSLECCYVVVGVVVINEFENQLVFGTNDRFSVKRDGSSSPK